MSLLLLVGLIVELFWLVDWLVGLHCIGMYIHAYLHQHKHTAATWVISYKVVFLAAGPEFVCVPPLFMIMIFHLCSIHTIPDFFGGFVVQCCVCRNCVCRRKYVCTLLATFLCSTERGNQVAVRKCI